MAAAHHPHHVPPPPGPHVTVVTAPVFGPNPITVQCSSCHEMVKTRTSLESTGKTHLIALAMCILQCWICIPCIYCCCDSLKDTHHHCPKCNTFLGSYSSL